MLTKVICYRNKVKVANENFSNYDDALSFAIKKNTYDNCLCLLLVYNDKTNKWHKATTLYYNECY